MKTLIIPDIHCKHSRAEAIIQHVPHDQVVLLGDYFDDWKDSPDMNAATAEWLKGKLADPTVLALWGNHDQHYLLDHRRWICSGYDPLKKLAIRAILTQEDIAKLALAVTCGGYLLSHAGFDRRLVGEAFGRQHLADFANYEVLPLMLEGEAHRLLGIPFSRGGDRAVGGITWQDWTEFYDITDVPQIVGHTEVASPRWEGDSVCLDTRLHHYGLITDGELIVEEVTFL